MPTPTAMMKDAKFYLARRDTRWDPYPQRQPLRAIAHDWHGFWERSSDGSWFKTPVSYNLMREVTRTDAEAFIDETETGARL